MTIPKLRFKTVKNPYYGLKKKLKIAAKSSNEAMINCIPLGTPLRKRFDSLEASQWLPQDLYECICENIENDPYYLLWRYQRVFLFLFLWCKGKPLEVEASEALRLFLVEHYTEEIAIKIFDRAKLALDTLLGQDSTFSPATLLGAF